MTPIAGAVYLHGFASSPASSKAQWFGRELAALGVACACPDFNEPAFESLTTTRMLAQTADAVARMPGDGPVALVGSSLGAFVALHAAAADRTGRVDRLVLLAPALDFGGNRLRDFGPYGIDEWKQFGRLRVHHYGFDEPRDISYALYEDAAAYDAFAIVPLVPTLVVHGRRDTVVDPAMVERWAHARPDVTLRMIDDDHQLKADLSGLWQQVSAFLGLTIATDPAR